MQQLHRGRGGVMGDGWACAHEDWAGKHARSSRTTACAPPTLPWAHNPTQAPQPTYEGVGKGQGSHDAPTVVVDNVPQPTALVDGAWAQQHRNANLVVGRRSTGRRGTSAWGRLCVYAACCGICAGPVKQGLPGRRAGAHTRSVAALVLVWGTTLHCGNKEPPIPTHTASPGAR